MHHSSFIGIDLAWQSSRNPSGAAALTGDRRGAELRAVTGTLRSLDAVLEFVAAHDGNEVMVAVDAPLIIPNETGQRLCETLVSRAYGSRHASCHTSNRSRYPDAGSVRLAESLRALGYQHAGEVPGARVMLEVYPHPALIELFALPSILRYKKGSSEVRAHGLGRLQELIRMLAGFAGMIY